MTIKNIAETQLHLGKSVSVGTVLPSPVQEKFVIWTDEAELRPHIDRPWLRAYASAYLGADAPKPKEGAGKEAAVPEAALARHTCVFGSPGFGKSRLTLHLLAEQMKQGCSVLALDPKPKTIEYLLACSRQAGVPKERIVVLDPADMQSGIPGWNPLQTDIPSAQAAVALVSILRESTIGWGPRLGDILVNALILLASHGLTVYELQRFLQRKDYRDGVLRQPRPSQERLAGGQAAFTEAWEYFAREFSALSVSDQNAAVHPVLTRTRALLRSDFFQALLCARHNTLDLASLWQEPGVVIVHLDRAVLGDDDSQLLGGLLSQHLYLTAMRQSGPVPVILALDELGAQERFVGDALQKIVTVAREQNLRLLVATQHMESLSEGLRKALFANSQVQAFFQLGHDDAVLAAREFATGAPEPLRRVTARIASRDTATGKAARSEWRHELLDTRCQPLQASKASWAKLSIDQVFAPPGERHALIQVQKLAALSGVVRLYVRAADSGELVALSVYVAGLPETEYRFEGPAPLELVVSFPTPQFVHPQRRTRSDLVDRWATSLKNLPERQAALSLWHGDPDIVRIVDVPTPTGSASDLEWSRATRSKNSQSWKEIEATRLWRESEVERLSLRPEPAAPPNSSRQTDPPQAAPPPDTVGSSAYGSPSSESPSRASLLPAAPSEVSGPPKNATPHEDFATDEVAEDGSLA